MLIGDPLPIPPIPGIAGGFLEYPGWGRERGRVARCLLVSEFHGWRGGGIEDYCREGDAVKFEPSCHASDLVVIINTISTLLPRPPPSLSLSQPSSILETSSRMASDSSTSVGRSARLICKE